MKRFATFAVVIFVCGVSSTLRAEEPVMLPGTQPMTMTGDMSVNMRAGIDKFVNREIEKSVGERTKLWKRDFSSPEAYDKSIAPNREHFRKLIGAVDPRLPITEMQYISGTSTAPMIGQTDSFRAYAIRWPVLEGVWGEGLLLQPKGDVKARVVAIPDADQTPEMIAGITPGVKPESQFARRLAESGCQVIVPVLIDRNCEWSGDPTIWLTNQPHREWVYRPAFELGRHPIGYEVQKVLQAIDWFASESKAKGEPIALAGFGEGGLIAMYAAALDTRVKATLVSGYFDSRQDIAHEPLYRNLFGLLAEFGDAEIASMITPRLLVIEHSEVPKIDGPPAAQAGRQAWAAPGAIRTPKLENIKRERERLTGFKKSGGEVVENAQVVAGEGGVTVGPGWQTTMEIFLEEIGGALKPLSPETPHDWKAPDANARQHRQLTELVEYTQVLLRKSYGVREAFWKDADGSSVEKWKASVGKYRDYFWDEVIGRFPKATEPANPRTRKIIDDPKFTGYEVMLDVYPDVFCWGILLVPKDIKPGEHRPVIVCQHGLEGEPMDVVTTDPKKMWFNYYHGFATRLAERGFVTYAPHNFYKGGNDFRMFQRKLNPLKKSMFSIILAQHERHLEWLGNLPFVDAKRIGFYGLSYGGFSAIRLPPMLSGYALSISSGEFSDMAQKSVSVYSKYSYPFYNCSEVWEWNLANTFGYSDLAGLILPRPFMVERGHRDDVSPDEWVAAEYSKVRRRYDEFGLGDRTTIEFFNGKHEIHSTGTFEFLHKHLNWPAPSEEKK